MDLVRLVAIATDDELADARSALQLIAARGYSRNRDLVGDLKALLGESLPD